MKATILVAVAAGLCVAACARRAPDDPAAVTNAIAAEGDFNGGSVLTNDDGAGEITTVPVDETADGHDAAADQANGAAPADSAP